MIFIRFYLISDWFKVHTASHFICLIFWSLAILAVRLHLFFLSLWVKKTKMLSGYILVHAINVSGISYFEQNVRILISKIKKKKKRIINKNYEQKTAQRGDWQWYGWKGQVWAEIEERQIHNFTCWYTSSATPNNTSRTWEGRLEKKWKSDEWIKVNVIKWGHPASQESLSI